MKATDKTYRTATVERHLASWQGAIREAITIALKRNEWKATPVAIPLALANSAANEVARDHQFSILTAEQVISEEEVFNGKGVIVYYTPTFMKEDENEQLIARLKAYSTNNTVLLFVLLLQNIPIPSPSTLESAWVTGLFKTRELYEVSTSSNEVTLSCLKPVICWWRRQQLASWAEPFMGTSNDRFPE